MEDIRKYFVKRLPQDMEVIASRKEDNDCPKLRREHPFIKNFEDDYSRLTPDQKEKIKTQRNRLTSAKRHSRIGKLPPDHPERIAYFERKREAGKKHEAKCKGDPVKTEHRRKRWRKANRRRQVKSRRKDNCGPSHTEDASNNQQTCPEPDTEIIDLPREELEQFETLLTPQLLDKLGPPFDWDLNEPILEASDGDLNEPLGSWPGETDLDDVSDDDDEDGG
jgi:hypothetical protein